MDNDLPRRPLRSSSEKAHSSGRNTRASPKISEGKTPRKHEEYTPRKQKLSSTPEKEDEYEDDSKVYDDEEPNFEETCRANLGDSDNLRDCEKTFDARSVNPMDPSSLIKAYWPVVLFCGVALGVGYKVFSPSGGLTGKSMDSIVSHDLGESVVQELKKKFTNQAAFSFKTVKKSVNRVILPDEPESPSAVILISSKGAEETVNCFANHFAKLVHKNKNFVNIDGKQFQNKNPDVVKETIDEIILEYASHDTLPVVLIKNIEYLPGKAPFIFYKYCDDQNAPFKRAIVIMTVFGEKPLPEKFEYKEINSIVYERLNTSWANIPPDQFDPLYNRIAGFITGINDESDLSHC